MTSSTECVTGPRNPENDRRHWAREVEKTATHRDAQALESLARKLRKIGIMLTSTFRRGGDGGQLNSQLATLHHAAATLEWLAREDRAMIAAAPQPPKMDREAVARITGEKLHMGFWSRNGRSDRPWKNQPPNVTSMWDAIAADIIAIMDANHG